DLKNLPLLTRSDLQDSTDKIRCHKIKDVSADATGGSTGEPVRFFHDETYRNYHDALELLLLSWMNISPGMRTLALWGVDEDQLRPSLKARLSTRMKQFKIFNTFGLDESDLSDLIEQIESYQPKYIIGYASSLAMIADALIKRGELAVLPTAVRSAAEMLYDHQRESVEKAFGKRLFNVYGSREVSHLASECAEHDGLHIFEPTRIIEITDDIGHPLPPGEIGHIVVTDLTNYCFPFIRYRNGDMGVMDDSSCRCGRGMRRLSKIVGRTSDILSFNGRTIHGEFFTHLFYHRNDTRRFQVIQESDDRLTVLIVPRSQPYDSDQLRKAIEKQVGPNVTIDINLVESIAPPPSGKHRFTINRTAVDAKRWA
ncbi:MAG: hypothetical protein V3T31_01245, partial [candidate division Zixibacteria bacterium]